MLVEIAPGFVAQALVLPQGGISKALGAGDDHAIDVTAQTTISRREAKLFAIHLAGAQVESGCVQPGDHAVFHDVTALEDAQHAPLNMAARIDGRFGELVLQRPLADHTQTGSPKVVPAGLVGPGTLHSGIDQRGELT